MSRTLAKRDQVFPPKRVIMGLGLALALIAGGMTTTGLAQGTAAGHRDAASRPVAVWPPGPLEVIAAFDRPVDPAMARAVIGQTIPYSNVPEDGTRQTPPSKPAGRLRIVGARLTDDGRTLLLATDPHPRVARYWLPPLVDRSEPASNDLSIPTAAYDLSGVEVAWSEGDAPGGEPKWSGWWPSLDLDASRRLTRGSRRHETGWSLLSRSGHLALSTWIRLPAGRVTVRVEASIPIEEATLGDAQAASQTAQSDGKFRIEPAVDSRGEPLFLTMTLRTGDQGQPFSIKASYRLAGEPADHPIERDRLLLPWAPTSIATEITAPVTLPDLSGGDPDRGRTIFRGDQARCAQCHLFRGEGGQVGPDLTDITSKGRAEIYRSIAVPSATIEPDYTTYTVATRDGQVLSGVVRAEGPDSIRVTDINAKASTVRRDQIQEIRPSATSTMPPGLVAALGDSAVRDLIAYLTLPASPPRRRVP
jgi:putative heme-binding domain-containing protein